MSDGNFNRALLPHTPFASGLAIGRKQGLQAALQAFDKYLAETFPGLSPEERERHRRLFTDKLSI